VCLQEHWLCADQVVNFNSVSNGFDAYAVSSLPSNTASSSGKPYGGLAVLVNRAMFKVTNIGASLDNRVQGLHLSSGCSFLLFNVYCPCLSSCDDCFSKCHIWIYFTLH
jgi:hypothetical protein